MSKMLIVACFVVGASAQWDGNGGNTDATETYGRGRECFDGVDHDGDGSSACSDAECERDPRIRQRCQRMALREGRNDGISHETGKQCFDGIDNDGDGGMDCEDPDCQRHREGYICREIESLGNQILNGRTNVGTPQGCINWFDGCNTCKRKNRIQTMICSKKICFRQGLSECRAYDRAYKGEKDTGVYDIRDVWRQGGTLRRRNQAGICRCGNCMNGDCKPCGGSCFGSGQRSCECGACVRVCHCGNRNSHYECRSCCSHRRLLDGNNSNSTPGVSNNSSSTPHPTPGN